MITFDERKCGYCGSCVSVCPAEALLLWETRLLVLETCTSCGRCVSACPVGALSLKPETECISSPGEKYDLVVVGAGPAGAMAAYYAAQEGLAVLLVDKRQEIGVPVQCAEGISHDLLLPFLEPDPRWISAYVDKAEINTVSKEGLQETLRANGAKGYILERRVFDRVLVERAVAAGAQAMVKTMAIGLLREGGIVKGVRLASPAGYQGIEADIVIAADGVGSLVGRWAGLDTRLAPKDLMTCAQYLLAGIDIDSACTYYYLGEEIAPGGYAWIFPKGENCANVGLGVQSDLADRPPLEYLTRFIERYAFLAQGSPVCLVVGGVPVSLPPARLVADGLMLVGDAARQVDPLTGGGIANAMAAGRLAAEVAAAAISASDVSAGFLSRYEARWSETLGRKMARNYRLRERFPPGQRSGPRFLRAFATAIGG